MTISAPPPLPTRKQSGFSDVFSTFLTWFTGTFIAQFNADIQALNLNSTNSTSTTSNSLGTGAKSFTVQTGKSYVGGMYITVSDSAAPSTNAFYGTVTSYNSGTGALVMNAETFKGSGTLASWIIAQTSPGGVTSAGVSSTIQSQSSVAFTTAGTSPTFTIATSPLYGARAAGQRMRVKFNAAVVSGASTLNRDSTGAVSLKQYDSSGAKIDAVIAANQLADIEDDGTHYVILDPLPFGPARGSLGGLTLSPAGSSGTMTIAAGQAADSTNSVNMTLISAMSKTTSAFAVGTGNGGLDEGTIANNKYYSFFIIRRPDTGVVDAIESLSPGTSSTVTMTIATPAVITWTDHGLQANAGVVFATTGALPTGLVAGTRYYVSATGLAQSSFQVSATQGGASIATSGTQSGVHTASTPPALPANFTQYRYVGQIPTNGSAQWVPFTQVGDEFYLGTPVLDLSIANSTTAALVTCSVPKGRKIKIFGNMQVSGTSGVAIYLTDPANADIAPNGAGLNPLSVITYASVSGTQPGGQFTVWTNTSAQIRYRSSAAAGSVYLATLGWVDLRDRNL
jgi:hypothetical protein